MLKIFSIDIGQSKIEVIDHSQYGIDFNSYLLGLIELIIKGGSGRSFRFDRESTEVRAQISRVIAEEDFNDITQTISARLLSCEQVISEKMAKLKVEIQKGIVVQALINEDGIDRFVICKAEHNEFLNEVDFKKSKGLPIKKKVFKAVICYLKSSTVQNVLVYDSNPNLSQYWWKDFLELTKVYSDEDNTENAFDAIDKNIFNKLKKEFPQDYTFLRNSTVRYFRAKDSFNMQDYLDEGLGEYKPYNEKLNIHDLKEKIKKLPTESKNPFDEQFNIVKDKIKARFINKIHLTHQIDLVLKEDIFDLKSVVTAWKDTDGTKYVKIKSIEGYKYFDNLVNEKEQ